MSVKKTYGDKLLDVRWQKKRLEILNRDRWTCRHCEIESYDTLHVHHITYEPNTDPWDYSDEYYMTLCYKCHEIETNARKEIEPAFFRAFYLLGFEVYDLQTIIDELKVAKEMYQSHKAKMDIKIEYSYDRSLYPIKINASEPKTEYTPNPDDIFAEDLEF